MSSSNSRSLRSPLKPPRALTNLPKSLRRAKRTASLVVDDVSHATRGASSEAKLRFSPRTAQFWTIYASSLAQAHFLEHAATCNITLNSAILRRHRLLCIDAQDCNDILAFLGYETRSEFGARFWFTLTMLSPGEQSSCFTASILRIHGS